MTASDKMPAPLSKSVIDESCTASGLQIEVHVLESVDSTNTWLLDGDFSSPITLCAAEHQTVGRGRRGKTWHSPNSGITFSMRFNLTEPIARFSGLSLLVGSVLCDSLRDLGVTQAMVKWPNDVLVQGSKLAGILIESRTVPAATGTVLVVGMGVNYIRGEEARLIDQASIDLSTLCGADNLPDRSQLISDIATRLVRLISDDVPQSLIQLVSRWMDYDALDGAAVIATVAGKSAKGQAAGIDENGSLLVETIDGIRAFNSADVTVRKHNY